MKTKDLNTTISHPHEKFMMAAIEIARTAIRAGDYPVGAVLVYQSEIISIQHTRIQSLCDPTAHAEMLVIREAVKKMTTSDLSGCFLYTTLEPCPMCTAAAIWAKLEGIVFGATTQDGIESIDRNRTDTHDWRQINIRSRDIIDQGEPKLKLFPEFMRSDCLELLRLRI